MDGSPATLVDADVRLPNLREDVAILYLIWIISIKNSV